MALILLGSTRADARPLDYGSASCNPGGGTDVCTYDSVHDHWKCNLADITSGTTAATAWMIHGENDCDNICDGNPYCAFGVKNGVTFYCDLPAGAGAADDMVQGWLIGTPGADWLSFWYEEGTVKCVMENANLGVVSVVTGKIPGYGGIGGDYICTDAGDDDIAYGGTGDDEIWDSSTGTNDWAYGDDGTDSCKARNEVSCETGLGSRPPECPTETTPY